MAMFSLRNFEEELQGYLEENQINNVDTTAVVSGLDQITIDKTTDWNRLKSRIQAALQECGLRISAEERVPTAAPAPIPALSAPTDAHAIREALVRWNQRSFGDFFLQHMNEQCEKYLCEICDNIKSTRKEGKKNELKYLYALFKLTGVLTHDMIHWIILTRAPEGDLGNLRQQLGSPTFNWHNMERTTVMRIMLALQIDDKEARRWLRDQYRGEDFNPRSVEEVVYLYALYHKDNSHIEEMLQNIQKGIMDNILGEGAYDDVINTFNYKNERDPILKSIKTVMYHKLFDSTEFSTNIIAYMILQSEHCHSVIDLLRQDTLSDEAYLSDNRCFEQYHQYYESASDGNNHTSSDEEDDMEEKTSGENHDASARSAKQSKEKSFKDRTVRRFTDVCRYLEFKSTNGCGYLTPYNDEKEKLRAIFEKIISKATVMRLSDRRKTQITMLLDMLNQDDFVEECLTLNLEAKNFLKNLFEEYLCRNGRADEWQDHGGVPSLHSVVVGIDKDLFRDFCQDMLVYLGGKIWQNTTEPTARLFYKASVDYCRDMFADINEKIESMSDSIPCEDAEDTISILEGWIKIFNLPCDQFVDACIERQAFYETPDTSKSRLAALTTRCEALFDLYNSVNRARRERGSSALCREFESTNDSAYAANLALLSSCLEGETVPSRPDGVLPSEITTHRFMEMGHIKVDDQIVEQPKAKRLRHICAYTPIERSDFLRLIFLKHALQRGEAGPSDIRRAFSRELDSALPLLRYAGFNRYSPLDWFLYCCLGAEKPLETYQRVLNGPAL